MKFNLIEEQWIPVIRRDGTKERIAPWQVTDQFDSNPIVELNAPRADFNGALIQFLIGLVQTAAAPEKRSEWDRKLYRPPSPEELLGKFNSVKHAFELGGTRPRFMQDFGELGDGKTMLPIQRMFIEAPGEQTCKQNQDHFIKRNESFSLCPACCATAMFCQQTNAPGGGRGHRTSIRGGGPLTTLVIGDNSNQTLWQSIWLNILVKDIFEKPLGNKDITDDTKIFPWLTATVTSDHNEVSYPEHFNPAIIYWAMPRRVVLDSENLSDGKCSICGKFSDSLIHQFQQKSGGMNFDASLWLHPLTPYYQKKVDDILVDFPMHPQPGGIGYRHWLGLVQKSNESLINPALVVTVFNNNPHPKNMSYRMRAFGYDTDNMKARCWYECTMPLIFIDPEYRLEYEAEIANLINVATVISANTRSAVKEAWFKRPKDVSGDFDFITSSFWSTTEEDFYNSIEKIRDSLQEESDCVEIKKAWHSTICKKSLVIFDECVLSSPIEDVDPKRVAEARKKLGNFNHGKKIKETLDIHNA